MQRPMRKLEDGTHEAFSDEEFIEYVAHHYETEAIEITVDFYDEVVHSILKFHAGQMNYEQFLSLMSENFSIHNEAYKRAISSSKDPIKWN